ncbi:MAG: serine/threonine protein kinase, partial [Candidatus Aenigmatarchaeota archaeon]
MMKIIARGAEAVISRDENDIIKERVAKHYRLKEIDERLRSSRTRAESRLLREARRAGVYVP